MNWCISEGEKRPGELGAALVESTMVVFLAALLIIGAVDVGVMLHRYMVLERICYEGARLASELPGLEVGTYNGVSGGAELPMHVQLHKKIEKLVDRYGISRGDMKIMTKRDGSNPRELEVKVEYIHHSLFARDKSIKIKGYSKGTYLLRTNDQPAEGGAQA